MGMVNVSPTPSGAIVKTTSLSSTASGPVLSQLLTLSTPMTDSFTTGEPEPSEVSRVAVNPAGSKRSPVRYISLAGLVFLNTNAVVPAGKKPFTWPSLTT